MTVCGCVDFPSALLKLGKTLVLCDKHGWTEIERTVTFREYIGVAFGIETLPIPDHPPY